MQLRSKNYTAYLCALSLLFSYAEMLFPRVLPFLKPGFSNIAVLLALGSDFKSLFMLLVFKSVAGSFMQGILFSPFFILSFSQSVVSGLVMFFLYRVNLKFKEKIFSLYGISLAGSFSSAVVQSVLSVLYLGKSVLPLTGIIILFSVFAGLLTAFLTRFFMISTDAPVLVKETSSYENNGSSGKKVFCVCSVLLSIILAFMSDNPCILFVWFICALVLQKISGRKIFFIPHISLWIFIAASSVFVPSGKVLFALGKLSITQGALLTSFSKALKLSAAASLSQSLSCLSFEGPSFFSLSLSYFSAVRFSFSQMKGSIIERIKKVLSAEELKVPASKNKQVPFVPFAVLVIISAALFAVSVILKTGVFYGRV